MAYTVINHPPQPEHYYVDGMLVAGAISTTDAVRIYEEAMAGCD